MKSSSACKHAFQQKDLYFFEVFAGSASVLTQIMKARIDDGLIQRSSCQQFSEIRRLLERYQ